MRVAEIVVNLQGFLRGSAVALHVLPNEVSELKARALAAEIAIRSGAMVDDRVVRELSEYIKALG